MEEYELFQEYTYIFPDYTNSEANKIQYILGWLKHIRAKLKQLKKGYDDNYDDIRAKSKQLKKSNAIC